MAAVLLGLAMPARAHADKKTTCQRAPSEHKSAVGQNRWCGRLAAMASFPPGAGVRFDAKYGRSVLGPEVADPSTGRKNRIL